MNKINVLFFSCVVAAFAFGGVVSEVAVPSESMGKNVPATVILPKGYDADSTSRWLVVYVLHGAGGSIKLCEGASKIGGNQPLLLERMGGQARNRK